MCFVVHVHVFHMSLCSLFLSDFLVKVVDLTDPSWISTQEGHEAPILSVEFSEHYLVSGCGVWIYMYM